MATPENEKKIRLQTVGWVPADEVGNLEVGDRIMWNGGNTSEVTDIEQVSRCFRMISLKSSETGKPQTPRRLKTTALVARIPQAKEETPTTAEIPPVRLAIGTRVRHSGQEWATSVQAPEGTAIVLGVGRTHADGSVEYKVLAGQDFSRHIGGDNPMNTPKEWNSLRVREVAPPPFEMPEPPNGYRFEIEPGPGRVTVKMYADGMAAPVHQDWTGHPIDSPVIPGMAREMIRVETAHREETAALLALDDATLYEVCEYRGSMPTGDAVTMTGSAARARLQAAREEAGPERLHGRNSPRFTLEHSGAHWWATTHAYTAAGHRDQGNRRHIAVQPLVTARAAQVLMEYTGDGCITPVEQPSVRAFGPWVRPVPNFPEDVVVHWVTCGTPVQPGAERYADHMETYRAALEGAGWEFKAATADGGMVFQEPERTA
jgi:hypothetical protein